MWQDDEPWDRTDDVSENSQEESLDSPNTDPVTDQSSDTEENLDDTGSNPSELAAQELAEEEDPETMSLLELAAAFVLIGAIFGIYIGFGSIKEKRERVAEATVRVVQFQQAQFKGTGKYTDKLSNLELSDEMEISVDVTPPGWDAVVQVEQKGRIAEATLRDGEIVQMRCEKMRPTCPDHLVGEKVVSD